MTWILEYIQNGVRPKDKKERQNRLSNSRVKTKKKGRIGYQTREFT